MELIDKITLGKFYHKEKKQKKGYLFNVVEINPKLSITSQRSFFAYIFPKSIYDIFDPDRDRDASFWSRRFNGGIVHWETESVCNYLYHLKEPGTDNPCTYATSTIRQMLEENWKTVLADATKDDRDAVRKAALEIVEEAAEGATQRDEEKGTWQDEKDNCFFIHSRITRLKESQRSTEEILACLSLIAVTSSSDPKASMWEDVLTPEDRKKKERRQKNEAWNRRIYDLILPPLPDKEDYARALKNGISLLSEKRLGAWEHLNHATQSADEAIKGDAYYNLYLYWKDRKDEKQAAIALANAQKVGHPDAIAIIQDEQTGETLEERIKAYEQRKNNWKKGKALVDLCLEILRKGGKPETRGRAAWELYQLFSDPASLPTDPDGNPLSLPSGESHDAFLKLAHDLGCKDAHDEWVKHEAKKNAGITHAYDAAADLQDSGGTYCVTGPEELVSVIEKTAPKKWHKWEQLPSGNTAAEQMKYLFLSDDQEENLSNALEVMEVLRQQEQDPTQEPFGNKIYIRGNSEELQALVDTAAHRMGEKMAAVTVLDDDKWAAQDLLFHHPLFFPVRSLASKRKATLHFVIIGDARLAQWLVREAFCVMGFRKKGNGSEITCKITVLAPDANTVKSRVEYYCPGLVDGAISKDLVPYSEIAYQTIPAYDSPEFDHAVQTILRGNCFYSYFAVCAGGDTENLRIATKIRELQVRDVISIVHAPDVSLPALKNLPPIAFHCRNDDIAHLSRQLVAYNETYGDQWFNNWSLIPFGTRSERYAWDKLDGLLDQLAWAFHWQYAGAETPEKRDKAQRNYYAWGYNQDSSRGAAVSLPYRLFQFHCKDNTQLFSPAWQITDRAYFATPGQLKALGKRLLECVKMTDETEIRAMARWEHDRFIRWMLAHGWLPDSPQQAAAFYHAGNHRQQLFIARMHPCICGYDDLDTLSTYLKEKCNMNKDFRELDRSSIQSTPCILGVERDLRQNREKEEERDDH